MDKRILWGGAAALAAYFLWVSRSKTSNTTTVIPSTTPNGVGFGLGDLLSVLTTTGTTPVVPPDQVVKNPVTGGQTPPPVNNTKPKVSEQIPAPSFGSDNPNFDTSYRATDEYKEAQKEISRVALSVMGY